MDKINVIIILTFNHGKLCDIMSSNMAGNIHVNSYYKENEMFLVQMHLFLTDSSASFGRQGCGVDGGVTLVFNVSDEFSNCATS